MLLVVSGVCKFFPFSFFVNLLDVAVVVNKDRTSVDPKAKLGGALQFTVYCTL